MAKKVKLKELILKAQSGDKDALNQVIERLEPIAKKYARRFKSEDIYSEVVEWIIKATMKYNGKGSLGREELKNIFQAKKDKENF